MPGCVQQHSFGEKISLQMRGLRPAAAHSPQRARLARLQAEKCFWPGTRPGQKRILYFSRLRARTLRGWPFCKAGWVDRGTELRYSGGGSGRSARFGWKSRALETVTGQGGGWAVLTPGGGCGILKVQKGTAASGQPLQVKGSFRRNRHRPGWRFLRFTMIVTVKGPMCKVIRTASPPFGSCG